MAQQINVTQSFQLVLPARSPSNGLGVFVQETFEHGFRFVNRLAQNKHFVILPTLLLNLVEETVHKLRFARHEIGQGLEGRNKLK